MIVKGKQLEIDDSPACSVEKRMKLESRKLKVYGMSKTKVPSTGSPDEQSESGVEVLPVVETPRMYAVILLNDDYTPMDFVVAILRRFFGKTEEEAEKVMLDVHEKGSGVAGVFTLEVAEMKVMQVNQYSQLNQHPLKCTMKEA